MQYAHAVSFRGVGVPQLVNDFRESSRDEKVQSALQIEKISKRAAQLIPFAKNQKQVDAHYKKYNQRERAGIKQFHEWQCSREEPVGSKQGNSEEQITVEQFFIPRLFRPQPALAKLIAIRLGSLNDQLLVFEELDEAFDFVFGGRKRARLGNRFDQGFDAITRVEMRQQLEFQPANSKNLFRTGSRMRQLGEPSRCCGP